MGEYLGMVRLHPTAVVAGTNDEPGQCSIGPGTKIWHFAHIRGGAIIGAKCVIGKGVYVDADVRIGDGCHLQNGVNIYSGVVLEDDVFVGPGVQFTNDKHPKAGANAWTITPTLVKKGASIGAGAVIVCGVTIGAGAMVGAGAVVTHNVEDGATVVGNPAYQLSQLATL